MDVNIDFGDTVQQVAAGFLWFPISNYIDHVAHGLLFNHRVSLRKSGPICEASQHEHAGLLQACDAHR
jgi:hypothetical protein